MQLLAAVAVLCLLARPLHSTSPIDQSFTSFCHNPPNFGKGVQEGNKCTVTYELALGDDVSAWAFCGMQHPFVLIKATTTASETVCEIHTVYDCSNAEQTIGDMCFSVHDASIISKAKKECEGVNRNELSSLHRVASSVQQRWIAAYFSNYGIVWIANGRNDIEHLLHDNLDGRRKLVNKYGRVVAGTSDHYAMITRKGSLARLRGGTIAPMDSSTEVPALCSRRATPRQELSAVLAKRYELFNIQSKTYKVKDKQLYKAFTVVKGAFPYSGISGDMHLIGGGETHYKLCEGFKHGSPATTLDFENVDDFKELLRDADVNVVAVPGRMKRHAKREHNYDCGKRDPAYNRKRDDWEYQRKTSNGTYYFQNVGPVGWKDGHPDNACADSPRVALVFSKDGLIDVPAFARHSVACTFGYREPLGCAVNAELKDGKCQCIDPAEEMSHFRSHFLFLKADDDLMKNPMQTLCFSCRAYTEYAAVVIMDASKSQISDSAAFRVPFYHFRAAFAHMKVPVRIIHAGDGGIRHDTKKFHTPVFSKELSSDTLGQSTDWKDGGSGELALESALNEAIEALRYHPYARKVIHLIVFAGAQATDHDHAEKKAKEAANYGIDIVVIHYFENNVVESKFDSFATTKKVFGHDYHKWADMANAATRGLHYMYRKICLRF